MFYSFANLSWANSIIFKSYVKSNVNTLDSRALIILPHVFFLGLSSMLLLCIA
jgi:hypothetical protein